MSRGDDVMSKAMDRSGRIDLPALLDQFGGLREVLHEVIEVYLVQHPSMLEDVALAVTARDAASLARSAHALKGAVGIFGVHEAIEPAASLERAGKTGDLTHIDDLHLKLAAEAERLRAELQRLRVSLIG